MRILHVGRDNILMRTCGLTRYSEALMRAQHENGHEVSYYFAGRHYPGVTGPRLKRYHRVGIRQLEVVGGPINHHWTAGTRFPQLDVHEPAVERTFTVALRESRPEVVHVHELNGLSSAVIEQARAAGAVVLMTLHDYSPLCASVRLLDPDGRLCTRRELGCDCLRSCAGAPGDNAHLIELTLRYDWWRLREKVPLVSRLERAAGMPIERAVLALAAACARRPGVAAATPADYQHRREVNVRRLKLCDRLVVPSARVGEIYASLGVEADRLVVQRLTLPHIETIRPRRAPGARSPLTFVTLGGLASTAKGSRVVLEAVRKLEDEGRAGQLRVVVLGDIEQSARDAAADLSSMVLDADNYHPEQLDDILEGADVGLMPSIWEESHGFAGVEMLAKGLPVIGSALGGIPEYVRDGETGWLNRSASAEELAGLMARAVDDPDEVAALQRSVCERRAEFVRPMAEHAAEVLALYDELVAGTPGGSPPGGPK